MFLQRTVLSKSLHLRRYSQSAAAAALEHEPVVQLSHLEGEFPRPDPKYAETIVAIPRSKSGTSISTKERKAGRIPSIVFEQEDGQHGGNKRLISVQTNQIRKLVKHLGRSFFLSRLFDLEVRAAGFDSDDVVEKVRVLPRKVFSFSVSSCLCEFSFRKTVTKSVIFQNFRARLRPLE
ncbi:hypothetical protein CJ030_MR1G027472 [Morella rubra]|uniref:Large ribosomal subunit protein bL25 L25 domain-containing protein n=1 Tax=Morella rubra TaxID=262757 RepID=A0A6A1WMT8_9ROSI|nr:hypothetical protein CJ030_MR1G027472 [Morella rubra]